MIDAPGMKPKRLIQTASAPAGQSQKMKSSGSRKSRFRRLVSL